MKKLVFILALVMLTLSKVVVAQNVGINSDGSTPDGSAMLDVSSTTKGFLAPRMTAEQRGLISSPAPGLLVYQTDAPAGYYYYNGSVWTLIGNASGATQWTTSGSSIYYNSGNVGIGTTSPSANKLVIAGASGTTDKGLTILDENSLSAVDLMGGQGRGYIGLNNAGTRVILFNAYTGGDSYINNGGNVGIGTTSPQAKLHVVASDNNGLEFDPSYSSSGGTRILAYNRNTPAYIPMLLDASYITFNTGSSAERMRIDASGNVGIGTTNPTTPLYVAATVNGFANPNGSNIRYFNYDHDLIQETSNDFPILNTVSIYSAGDIVTYTSFVAASDKRIKTNIKDINGSLGIIKKLRPVQYTKIDKLQFGNRLNYGFIAQEVEKIIPNTVNTGKGEVPILKPFEKVNFEDGVTYTILVKNGDDIKEQKYTTADSRPQGEIIVKSKEVNDFKSLSYDMIFTVAVDAIQEQQKEIDELKTQNAILTQKADAIDQLKAQNEVLTRKTDAIDQLKAEVENLKKMIITGGSQLSEK